MEMFCAGGDWVCTLDVVAGGLHALQAYCCAGALLYLTCCNTRSKKPSATKVRWWGHNLRGLASVTLLAVWCCAAAAAAMRPRARVSLAAALAALPAWLAAAALHVALERRGAAAALPSVLVYWAAAAGAAAARVAVLARAGAAAQHVTVLLSAAAALLAAVIAVVDSVVMYIEIRRRHNAGSDAGEAGAGEPRVVYRHDSASFYSAVTFCWLRSLLRVGCARPLQPGDLGRLPARERSAEHYHRFKAIYHQEMQRKNTTRPSLWRCYLRAVWPNFVAGGALKLLGDAAGLAAPLGLAAVVRYAARAPAPAAPGAHPTLTEFVENGYVTTLLILLASLAQGLLSQNSTHLVYVEGMRLKTALQGLIFDKSMNLASWSKRPEEREREPLLPGVAGAAGAEGEAGAGLLTNLISQDTYNVMSLVWIGHYVWAIPLKVKITVILYLLYTKLGVSAVIGSAVAILVITPLQFYIGKRMSDNSKEISKRSDHRIEKISEILQGMKMIKLCVWEDLFKEKILNLREVELQLLNKESVYWGILTFITHVSTVLMTVVTFSAHLALGQQRGLAADSVFAALALIHQLAVPLAVLPVAVYMIVQATVSTKRIENFMSLPESCNTRRAGRVARAARDTSTGQLDTAFLHEPEPCGGGGGGSLDNISEAEEEAQSGDFNSDEDCEARGDEGALVRLRGAVFAWGESGDDSPTLEVDDLEIPAGKLIMVVGPTGSGKSSLLSALLGEMQLERGDVLWSGSCTTAYAGQPPWLVNEHVRENIVLGGAWCARRYARVLRAAALKPDLQLLPEGDLSRLGALGVSLSGGQRARVCVARALYSRARLVALDEPLAALDAALARHVLARGLAPAARAGRTLLVATNRRDLLHYADIVVVMDGGRVAYSGAPSAVAARAPQLAAGLRAAAGAGEGERADPAAGGAARERWMLSRAVHRASLKCPADDEPNRVAVRERRSVYGSHYLAELPADEWCGGGGTGSWARRPPAPRTRTRALLRQLSSPPAPAALPHLVIRQQRSARAVRRAVSADTSSAALRREASTLRRLLRPAAFRWTPRPLRRLFSGESAASADLTDDTENETAGKLANDTEAVAAAVAAAAGAAGEDGRDAAVQHAPAADTEPPDLPAEDTAGVQARVYWAYVRACGVWAPAYCAAALACQALAVAADYWLARWTAAAGPSGAQLEPHQMWSWLRGYCWVCGGGALAAAAAQGCAQAAGAAARRRVHDRLLHVVLHLPLTFFDQTPLGRSLNRFSADVLVLDKKLASAAQRWSHFGLLCVSAVLVNAVVTPWCLLVAAPLTALYFALQTLYSRNARSLQRLEAESAGPLVSLLVEASAGAAVIRAGGLQPRMRRQFLQRLDANHNAFLLLNSNNRWLGVALDLLGACVVSAALAAALAAAPPGLLGLVAAYTMLLPAYLAWVVKFRAELDACLGALERIQDYTDLPTEDYREDAGADLPTDWPSRGEIVFDGVSVRHAPHLAPVLRDVTLTIPPGQKVAVCGRSGGGKSSLVLACAGAADVCAGALLVDGVDVRRVPLRRLRRRLCVLPQEATLFAGTLRENLDPLAVHTDAELWGSLRAARLHEFAAAHPAGLECPVRCGGAGWSAGQRARACCARAVLCASRAAALLLDEPGAALDARAEAALLAALAAAAPTRTLITVAHRLSAVCEYERVLTVDGGTVAEAGSPATLLSQVR